MTVTEMRDSTFVISGLNCAGCVNTLTRKALGIYGVVHVDVDLDPGRDSQVVLRHADALEPGAIAAALDGLGYRVVETSSR
jgi:copper chaperone CopZ